MDREPYPDTASLPPHPIFIFVMPIFSSPTPRLPPPTSLLYSHPRTPLYSPLSQTSIISLKCPPFNDRPSKAQSKLSLFLSPFQFVLAASSPSKTPANPSLPSLRSDLYSPPRTLIKTTLPKHDQRPTDTMSHHPSLTTLQAFTLFSAQNKTTRLNPPHDHTTHR